MGTYVAVLLVVFSWSHVDHIFFVPTINYSNQQYTDNFMEMLYEKIVCAIGWNMKL